MKLPCTCQIQLPEGSLSVKAKYVRQELILDDYELKRSNKMELMQDDAIIEELKKAPVADVTPIVHAKWIYQDDEHVCSHCKGTILYELDNQGDAISEDWPWCARCGAKMDGRN